MADIAKEEREKIFESFIENHKQKFSDIEKSSEIPSNKLSYHINSMIKDDLLVKEDDIYMLSKKAEKLIPFFAHLTGKELGNLCVVLCAVIKDNRIFLMKRKKRPYKDYWGFIGGKIKLEDTIEEAAVREVEEETGLKCRFTQLNSVLHERVRENNEFKHAFVLFLCTLTPETDDENSYDTEEGLVDWFDIDTLNKDTCIPSDYYMVRNMLKNKTTITEVIQEDKDEKLVNLDIKEV